MKLWLLRLLHAVGLTNLADQEVAAMGNKARPMTPEEAKKAVAAMSESMDKHGAWNKLCLNCGLSVGGRLAEYGKPEPEDLARCMCPRCGHEGARAEFIPAKEKT